MSAQPLTEAEWLGLDDELRQQVADAFDVPLDLLGEPRPRCRKCEYLAEGKWDGWAGAVHSEQCPERQDKT